MWNALAGYGGLVSVGQQAFIGIGAYGTVFLSVQHSLNPYLAMLLATLIGGAVSMPVAVLVLWLRGGAFAIATWVVAEIFAILVSLDAALGGGTGTSLLAFNLSTRPNSACATRTGWRSALRPSCSRCSSCSCAAALGASLQAIRDDEEAAASVGVRVLLGKGVLFVLAGAGCAAAGAVILAGHARSARARLDLRRQLVGEDDLHGARRRARHVRGADHRRDHALPDPDVRLERGRLVLRQARARSRSRSRCCCRAASGARSQDRFGLQLLPVGYRLRAERG